MKFELKPDNRNASNDELLNDLKKVAENLNTTYLGKIDYQKHGRFSYHTISRRFGSWLNALKLAKLDNSKDDYRSISDDELLNDLKKVSAIINKNSITKLEYEKHGRYSPYGFNKRFGSWFNALEKAGLEKTRELKIDTEDLFKNLEEVWVKLGRQPYITDMVKPLSKYSKDAYPRRFGSWRKALEAFVAYVNENDDSTLVEEEKTQSPQVNEENNSTAEIIKNKTTRNINWRLRFIVMKRDNFKCKKCGRSPSTDQTVILHIDHMKPYSKGGETVIENLETLCSVCNLGKSDLE